MGKKLKTLVKKALWFYKREGTACISEFHVIFICHICVSVVEMFAFA
jgi:hypothetical protein